jgi:hypothetical protein
LDSPSMFANTNYPLHHRLLAGLTLLIAKIVAPVPDSIYGH